MAEKNYGEWAFLLGVLLALFIGLFSGYLGSSVIGYVYAVLVLLGLVVGFLNIRDKEMSSFLIATIALIAASSSWQPVIGALTAVMTQAGVGNVALELASWINGFFAALVSFVSPAAFVVALKSIYNMAAKQK